MRSLILLTLFVVSFQFSVAAEFFVSTSGSDATGNGSLGAPWRTLKFAITKVAANQGHVIKLSAGTFVESGALKVPTGVSIEGSGMDQTILKSSSSFYYYPASPGFGTDKFLISLYSSGESNGNQSIKNLTIDGDGKKLHGGIFIQNRNGITIENVKVQYVNFSGIWLWGVKNSTVKGIKLKDCAWGSTGWCSGAFQIANSSYVDVSGFDIDEGKGYGMKNLGQTTGSSFPNIKVHDGRVSVNPVGLWNNGSAPNITIEFWGSGFPGTEIYNCYLDNHVSLVTFPVAQRSTPLKIHNNVFDIGGPRAKGRGYGIELSVYDVEVYNNWFNGGGTPIVNWGDRQFSNWNIHHNTVNGISSSFPTAFVNSYKGGLKDINVNNNTVEMSGTATVNFIEFNNGGVGENIYLKNNLVINSNTSYVYYPNRFISLEKGSTVKNLQVSNNLLYNLPIGTVPGNYSNNLTADPKITKTGNRPSPYYVPLSGSPLINAGVNVGLSFKGTAPTIGAHESGSTTTTTVAVLSVSLAPSAVTLSPGASQQLTATISPTNATNKSVTWSSSNTSIATVNTTGLVTAIASGSATITATTVDGKKTSTSAITVSPVSVSGVSITPSTVLLTTGGTYQLSVSITPTNATNKSVTWSSSNTSVATISTNGLVTAVASGNATITATTVDGKKTSTSAITVSAVSVSGVSITPSTVPLTTGGTYQLSVSITPTNATNKNVTWKSSNTSVATITTTGLVTATGAGSCTITVTTVDGSKTATALVAVNSTSIGGAIELDDAKLGTDINQFNYSGQGWTHGTNASSSYLYETVSYSNTSSDFTTLSFVGSKIELYTSKASHHGIAAVSVDNGPETYVDMYAATRQNFVAAYNSILTQGNHTIKIRVTGSKNSASTGTYVILDYVKVYSSVTTVAVTGVTVAPSTVSLATGSDYSLAATISPATATNKDVTWSSSNTGIALVSKEGKVTGVAPGSATITAKSVDGGKISTSLVTVYTPATGVTITPSSLPLNIGQTYTLTSALIPTNATNKTMSWISSNSSIATVNANGLVTAVAAGTAIITLTIDGGKTATMTVTVNPIAAFTFELDDAHKGTGLNQFQYAGGGWTNGTNSSKSYLYETVSFSNVAGNYATLTFTGNKVELYTSKASHHGIAGVSIDNGPEIKVDLYSATRQDFSSVFNSGVLLEGNHTIKIRVTGTKNASSSGTYAIIDYLKVHTATATAVPVLTTTPTDTSLLSDAKLTAETTGEIQIFPNPLKSGDILHVILPVASGVLSVIDVAGFAQYSAPVTTTELEIPTSTWPAGLYFVQHQTAEGKVLLKILVE